MSQHKPGLKQTLNLWQVVVMGLAYLTPMAVFDTFGIVSEITSAMWLRLIYSRWREFCLPRSVMAT